MNRVLPLVPIIALAAMAACARETPIPEIALGAADYAFTMPDSLAAGLVHVRMTNTGQEDHHAQFIRLNDGVTYAAFDSARQSVLQAAATEGEGAFTRLFQVASAAGGAAPVGPGGQAEAVLDLQAGNYVMLCFIPSPDGTPHLAKGMTKRFTVTASSGRPPAAPVATDTVRMSDFAFQMPAMRAGRTTVAVTNTGQEAHEFVIVRLKGITAEQFGQMMSAPPPPPPAGAPPPGPPPFEFVGGLQGIMPGQRAWTTLELTAGSYVAICAIPSAANQGRPHVALGMSLAFTVQ